MRRYPIIARLEHRSAGSLRVAVHDRGLRSWYQWFAPKARLEFADVVRDPRMQVR